MDSWPYVEPVLSVLLILVGFSLFMLNLLHGIWLMAEQKVRMSVYRFVSLLLFFGGSELFWAIIKGAPH